MYSVLCTVKMCVRCGLLSLYSVRNFKFEVGAMKCWVDRDTFEE